MSLHVVSPDSAADESTALHVDSSAREPRGEAGLGKLVGECAAMRDMYRGIQRVAPTNVSVFISGESGTGKELVAETIHSLSGRSNEPFIAVNCGAIPAALVESEMFGHERGSYTGAVRSQAGYFERAGRGTLFLDEAAEMPLDLQVKLLRALESRRICRVGGEREIPLQARVIAATNRPLAAAVSDHRLRADLLYRLAVFHIEVPALRQRGRDSYLLAQHFLARLNETEGEHKEFSADSIDYLSTHAWPGNVRELYNTVQRAYILGDRELDLRASDIYGPGFERCPATAEHVASIKPGMSLCEVERIVITQTLNQCEGNKTRTAAILGISLKTLYNRLNEYNALQAASTDRAASL
jgi:DNA-binding NtrC family response regulator